MAMLESNKGFTLIELVVALGIFITSFTLLMILIFSGIKLAYKSKRRTEAMAFTQKVMTEAIQAANLYSCSLDTEPSYTPPSFNGFVSTVNYEFLNNNLDPVALDNLEYLNITVNTNWEDGSSYSIKKLIYLK